MIVRPEQQRIEQRRSIGGWLLTSSGITVIYLLGSMGWILFSDRIVEILASNSEQLAAMQTAKGLTFVVLTSAGLFGLMRIGEWGRRRDHLRMREIEERFRIMADASPVLIWVSGLDKKCTFFNSPWLEFTGRTIDQELGDGWLQGVHPDDRDRCAHIYSAAFDARRRVVMEYRLRRHDGEYRWLRHEGVPRFDASGAFKGFIGSCVDMTEAIIDRQRQKVMMQELDHRVKNTLAAVIAVAESTFAATESREDFRSSFIGRVMAMANSHTALAKGRWSELEMAELVVTVLEPLVPGSGVRLDADGMAMLLPPQAVPPLAMVLHELATNAIKYGAWLCPGGVVRLRWAVTRDSDSERFAEIEWLEQGGPAITGPVTAGLGSRLMKGLIESELGGSLRLDYNPEGLQARMRFSIDAWRHAREDPLAEAHARAVMEQGA